VTQRRDSYYSYRVFGLRLRSDRPIDGLVSQATASVADISIRFGEWPHKHLVATELANGPFYRSPFHDESGRPVMSAWRVLGGACLRLLMSDGVECVIDGGGNEVWVDAEGVSSNDLSERLLGPILGIVLRRRGIVCLHASAVEVDGRAVAFAGPQRAGKSTIAALFAMRGYRVIADDLCALTDSAGTLLVVPGAPYLRMRPGAVETAAERLGRRADLTPSPDSFHVDLDLRARGYRASSSPLPLSAVYYLDWSQTTAGDHSRIESMNGTEALLSLTVDTWGARLLDRTQRATELDALARLVNHVPVRRIAQVDSPVVLELADRIAADAKRLMGMMPATAEVG
jgi:hypothetical protein